MKREPVGNERDQDRWLKAALTQPTTAASGDCLDTETLAAFADGGLHAQAAAAVELHASNCTRCAAILAGTERSRPSGAATHAWTPARAMRWLIPLTAAATAVAIWVAVPERPTTSVVDDLKTTSQVPAQVPVPPDSAPAPAPAPVPGPGSRAITKPGTQNQNPAPTIQNQEFEARADRSGQGFAPEVLRDAAGAGAGREAAPAAPPLPPAATPAEAPPGVARAEPVAGAERSAAQALSADTFAETVAPTAQRRALEAKVVVTSESAAPNKMFRWRVINSTSIQRSIDGGKTWTETIPLPRDSMAGLTIASIRATSDLHATVRMSNGSEFSTANGGTSWVHLQEK